MRTVSLFPVVLLGTLAVALAFRQPVQFEARANTLNSEIAGFELSPLVTNVDGISAADVIGTGPKIINVFASWCGACRFEHALLMQVARDSKVELFGIDWKDEPGRGAEWIATQGNPYRKIGEDGSGEAGAVLGVMGAPETLIVDAHGHVRFRHVGPLTPDIWKTAIEPIIRQLEEHS